MVDTRVKPEYDIVSPEAELKHCSGAIQGALKDINKLAKKIADLDKLPSFDLEIVLKADGKVVPIKGNDDQFYDKMEFTIDGKNVSNTLAHAAVCLGRMLPNPDNIRVRLGGEIDRLKHRVSEYEARIEKAKMIMDVRDRRKRGENV